MNQYYAMVVVIVSKILLSPLSPQIIGKLVAMLETLMKWVDEVPPIEQPQRFGNKAFRAWSDRVRDVRCCHTSYLQY